MEKIFDIAIVGSGAAGSMGTLRAVLNNLSTVSFLGSALTKKRSRAVWVGKVENMPALFDKPKAITQSATEVYQWIEKHPTWSQLSTSVKEEVVKITGAKGDFTLETNKGGKYRAKFVVLCTGIMDVQPKIGADIKNVYPMANAGHVDYCIRCDGHKSKNHDVTVIGSGEAAGWVAALLKERYEPPSVAVLSNGEPSAIQAGSPLAERLKVYGIPVIEQPIAELLGDPKTGLTGIRLADGTVHATQIAFVSMGTIVYNQLAKELGAEIDDRGYVVTDDMGETKVPGLFAAGDVRANKKKQIYTAWDMVVDSVDKADSYVRAEKREKWLGAAKTALS